MIMLTVLTWLGFLLVTNVLSNTDNCCQVCLMGSSSQVNFVGECSEQDSIALIE